MASSESKTLKPKDRPSSSGALIERVFVPTIFAGIVGGGVGWISKHRNISNNPAFNAIKFAFLAGCFCATREHFIQRFKTDPDDLHNSVLAGIYSGVLLGVLHDGRVGAAKYGAIFSVTGTAFEFTSSKVKASLKDYFESRKNEKKAKSPFKVPDWFPIQVLDEEQLAAKQARENQLRAQRAFIELTKEKS